MNAPTSGFPLHRHNVFFSPDYAQEFVQLSNQGRVPDVPTVYVCAQDRTDNIIAAGTSERLFCIVNAPANGDTHTLGDDEIKRHTDATFALLQRCGLSIDHWQAFSAPVCAQNYLDFSSLAAARIRGPVWRCRRYRGEWQQQKC